MSQQQINLKQLGDRLILLEWSNKISKEILFEVLAMKEALEKHFGDRIESCYSAYSSLALGFDPETENPTDLLNEIKALKFDVQRKVKRRRWQIPVCYENDLGKDLNVLEKALGISQSEIIKLHLEPVYTLFFYGFLPGFMYLGGLDERLKIPRKVQPDRSIPKGAVAIAGDQAGIYPMESPGGWYVIGNCPVSLFQVDNDPPCFAQPGDEIKFVAIDQTQYNQLQKKKADFVPQSAWING